MELIVYYVLSCLIGWVLLVVAMVLAQKIADISFPPVGEFLWKAAVVVAAASAATMVAGALSSILGLIVGFLTFLGLMCKLFDFDLFQVVIISLATWLLRVVAVGFLLAASR